MHSRPPGLPYPTVSTAAWRNHRLRPRVSSPDERRSNDLCADLQEPATAPVALCHCRLHSDHGSRSNYVEVLLAHAPGALPRNFLSLRRPAHPDSCLQGRYAILCLEFRVPSSRTSPPSPCRGRLAHCLYLHPVRAPVQETADRLP